jgi:hypothetical protein
MVETKFKMRREGRGRGRKFIETQPPCRRVNVIAQWKEDIETLIMLLQKSCI